MTDQREQETLEQLEAEAIDKGPESMAARVLSLLDREREQERQERAALERVSIRLRERGSPETEEYGDALDRLFREADEQKAELLGALEYVLEWGEDFDELGIQWPDVERKARTAIANAKEKG